METSVSIVPFLMKLGWWRKSRQGKSKISFIEDATSLQFILKGQVYCTIMLLHMAAVLLPLEILVNWWDNFSSTKIQVSIVVHVVSWFKLMFIQLIPRRCKNPTLYPGHDSPVYHLKLLFTWDAADRINTHYFPLPFKNYSEMCFINSSYSLSRSISRIE